jgi:hypothetical protein
MCDEYHPVIRPVATLIEVYEALAREMPQTKPSTDTADSWRCREQGAPLPVVPVTASDLAHVDEHGRPSGYLWALMVRVIREGGAVDINFYGMDRVDCDVRQHGCERWREGRADNPDEVSAAIARALHATLESR